MINYYRKPMSSCRCLNFHSYHKCFLKINLVKQVKDRVLAISHRGYHQENLTILYSLFRDHSYPEPLSKKIIFNTSSDTDNHRNVLTVCQMELTPIPQYGGRVIIYQMLPHINYLFVSLPYFRGVTKMLRLIDNITIRSIFS